MLGILGGSTTAAIMGALILQGWAVGPKLVSDHWEVVRAVIWAELLQAILMIPVAFVFCYYAWRVVQTKTTILVPMVGALMIADVFSLRGEPLDVIVAAVFGAFAWLMQKTDFPPLNFVIGMLLGRVMEGELVRTYATFGGRWELLPHRPLFLILLAALVIMAALTIRSEWR